MMKIFSGFDRNRDMNNGPVTFGPNDPQPPYLAMSELQQLNLTQANFSSSKGEQKRGFHKYLERSKKWCTTKLRDETLHNVVAVDITVNKVKEIRETNHLIMNSQQIVAVKRQQRLTELSLELQEKT